MTCNYAKEETIVKLGWLPVKERREFGHIIATLRHLTAATGQKTLNENDTRLLGLSGHLPVTSLRYPNIQRTFAYNAVKTFNDLPIELRNLDDSKILLVEQVVTF